MFFIYYANSSFTYRNLHLLHILINSLSTWQPQGHRELSTRIQFFFFFRNTSHLQHSCKLSCIKAVFPCCQDVHKLSPLPWWRKFWNSCSMETIYILEPFLHRFPTHEWSCICVCMIISRVWLWLVLVLIRENNDHIIGIEGTDGHK